MDEYTSMRVGLFVGGIAMAVGGFLEYRKRNKFIAVPLFILGVILAILSGTIL